MTNSDPGRTADIVQRLIADDVTPLSRRVVRKQLVAGLGSLPMLGDLLRDHDDRWPLLGSPGLWVVLDLRSDAGVQLARLGVENWLPEGVPSPGRWPGDASVDLPWPLARDIGRASAATRRLRINRGYLYWALEADRSEIHLAEQCQVDMLLAEKVLFAELIVKAAAKARRFPSVHF